MTKEELEVNIAALELLVSETADKSTDFKAQLEKAKQDIENMIFPDLERLVESALEAVYNDIRIANQSGLNIQKNITQRKALGLE